MNFIDAHCHLHDHRIDDRIPEMVSRARDAGVALMASCATMENNFERTAQFCREYPDILPFFGIHPWFIDSGSSHWPDVLEKALTAVPSGIGETGLDFCDPAADRETQVAVFETHLDMARQMGRPINIHIRKAWDTFIHILKKTGRLAVPGMIHSYSGSADMIPVFEKHNLFISFSGSVTNPGARKVVAALKQVSADRFVLETDTPDIYPYIPDPDPSRLNEPANLPAIARIAAGRINVEEILFCSRAYENSRRLFEPILRKRTQ